MLEEKLLVSRKWAEFKFSVVGKLLSSPPNRGELKSELELLASKNWVHPITGDIVSFSFRTLERWYYLLLNNSKSQQPKQSPLLSLRNKTRSDAGKTRVLTELIKEKIIKQYHQHSSWSYQLHADNLQSMIRKNPDIGKAPSYSTIKFFLRSNGYIKKRRIHGSAISERAVAMLAQKDQREIRSYENMFVNGQWHLDFHHASRTILTDQGEWVVPIVLAIIDDHSRLICHIQWYLTETARDLVHGFIQAVQKRGVPKSLLTDNGSAMLSDEFTNGLKLLGICHDTTLPYSPYQNGKQEVFWGQVEGRLLPMLESKKDLRLKELNDYTQAWIEMEYNREEHSETGTSPIKRFIDGRNIGEVSPTIENLKCYFRKEVWRTQRRSDGTVVVEGHRFEVPSRYHHLERLRIQYARWDLSFVHLIDANSGLPLSQLYPINKGENSSGMRRTICNPDLIKPEQNTSIGDEKDEIAPLLQELMSEYSSSGLPPAYLPQIYDVKKERSDKNEPELK